MYQDWGCQWVPANESAWTPRNAPSLSGNSAINAFHFH